MALVLDLNADVGEGIDGDLELLSVVATEPTRRCTDRQAGVRS